MPQLQSEGNNQNNQQQAGQHPPSSFGFRQAQATHDRFIPAIFSNDYLKLGLHPILLSKTLLLAENAQFIRCQK
jgi:hypothetical protein